MEATQDEKRSRLLQLARQMRALADIEYGEITLVIHQGKVKDVVETRRYRDEAENR